MPDDKKPPPPIMAERDEAERERFEWYGLSPGSPLALKDFARNAAGRYLNHDLNVAWAAWQARGDADKRGL